MTNLFLISLIFIVYTYLGYPLLLMVLGLLKKRVSPLAPGGRLPFLSLLVPVYNEGKVIKEKLDNILQLDYPRQCLEVVVVSDGSTDRTAEFVQPYLSQGVIFIDHPEHRGKMAVINRTLPLLHGEIVVFTDASAIFRRDALVYLATAFRDPTVGAASGELVLKEEGNSEARVRVDWYWRLEKFVRKNESAVFSCIAASGAVYALRRELFRPLPEDTVLDDFLIPLEAVRRGYRITFESRARAYEGAFTGLGFEFRRKVRTLAGNFQAFSRASWAFLPWKSKITFSFISHKFFRMLIPFALLLAFISSAAGPLVLKPFLGLQFLFYSFAGVGLISTRRGKKPAKLFSVPLIFCLLNGAAVWAYIIYFFKKRLPAWR